MTALLPCPWCGPGNSHVDPWFDDVAHRWTVGCGRCGCSIGRIARKENDSREAAIANWNRRRPRPDTIEIKCTAFMFNGCSNTTRCGAAGMCMGVARREP